MSHQWPTEASRRAGGDLLKRCLAAGLVKPTGLVRYGRQRSRGLRCQFSKRLLPFFNREPTCWERRRPRRLHMSSAHGLGGADGDVSSPGDDATLMKGCCRFSKESLPAEKIAVDGGKKP